MSHAGGLLLTVIKGKRLRPPGLPCSWFLYSTSRPAVRRFCGHEFPDGGARGSGNFATTFGWNLRFFSDWQERHEREDVAGNGASRRSLTGPRSSRTSFRWRHVFLEAVHDWLPREPSFHLARLDLSYWILIAPAAQPTRAAAFGPLDRHLGSYGLARRIEVIEPARTSSPRHAEVRLVADWIPKQYDPSAFVAQLAEQCAEACRILSTKVPNTASIGMVEKRHTSPHAGNVAGLPHSVDELRALELTGVGATPASAANLLSSHEPTHDDRVALLHEAVMGIAGRLSNIVTLIGRYSTPFRGRLMLDHHLAHPDVDPEPDQPERALSWRPVIGGLRTHVATARQLSDSARAVGDTSPRLMFASSSSDLVSCGPLTRNSYHDLVLAIGRLVLEPLDPGAIWHNEAALIACADIPPDDLGKVARLRILEELKSREWWQAAELGLERERSRWGATQLRHADDGRTAVKVGGFASARESDSQPTALIASQTVSSPAGTSDEDSASEARLFIREETAELRFAGVSCHLKLTLGLRVLHQLITRQGEDVPVAELVSGRTFEAVIDAEVMDPATIVACDRRLREIEEELSEKEQRCDLSGREELGREAQKVRDFLKTSTNHRGEPRRIGQDSRARGSVAQALGRLLKSLEEKHPQLHTHLQKALVRPSGSAPSYRPAERIEWMLE